MMDLGIAAGAEMLRVRAKEHFQRDTCPCLLILSQIFLTLLDTAVCRLPSCERSIRRRR